MTLGKVLPLLTLLFAGCGSVAGDTAADGDAGPDPAAVAGDASTVGSDAGDAADAADASPSPTRAPLIHGDYAAILRDSSGNVDVAGTIARLVEAHIDTYAYLILQKPQAEWDALPAFLSAAEAHGIQVWVYLVPPTEVPGGAAPCTGNYPPYQLDYVTWSSQIATLSLAHKNLTAFAMDDFIYNTPLNPSAKCVTFSAAYVAQMVAAAHAIAPSLGFWPVLYYPDLEGPSQVVTAIRSSIAGAIFPFRDGANRNTYVTTSAAPEITLLGASLSCKRDFKAAATRGHSGCYQIGFPWATASTAGAYGSAAQTVSVGAGKHAVTFSWQHDFAGATTGYVFAQLLVDGAVAWEADIGTLLRYTWREQTVSLDAAVAGKSSAKLELRVTHKEGVANFGHTVWFDELAATGLTVKNGAFEAGGTGWTPTKSTSGFMVAPVRTASLVTMVYAATLSSDPTHPPTAAYVGTVLDVGLSLAKQGYADGTMTYVLNKRAPNTPVYDRVKATY